MKRKQGGLIPVNALSELDGSVTAIREASPGCAPSGWI